MSDLIEWLRTADNHDRPNLGAKAAAYIEALERDNAELRGLAYAQTDKGPMLWKDIWQREVDAFEWYRSSANPIWEEVRASGLDAKESKE